MGSLEPLSSSIRARTSSRILVSWLRRTAKTAAASVEATTLPSRKPCRRLNSRSRMAVRLTMPALITTPTVARTRAGVRTGRTAFQGVSSPPEKRMKIRQATPMVWAT